MDGAQFAKMLSDKAAILHFAFAYCHPYFDGEYGKSWFGLFRLTFL